MRRLIFLTAGLLVPALLMAQLDRVWVNTYNSPYGTHEEGANAIAVDKDGYVYVCGSGFGPVSSGDYVTIKYDPTTGERLWVSYYDGPALSGDWATAIAVDNAGGVYVTGYSFAHRTGGGSYDYATIKYNASDGSAAWTQYMDGAARYNGPGNGNDSALAIAVDGSGNVYVTGVSVGSATTYDDFATVKYDANGIQQWATRYDRLGNDRAFAIAVDESGNSYVTGTSGYSRFYDYATVKYNSSGVKQWAVTYNGPGDWVDTPVAIAIDRAGNSYITGSSGGLGTGTDYATIKYDAGGSELWVARHDGPPGRFSDGASAIAVDDAGNVYVTGTCWVGGSNYYDCTTLKYDGDGERQWIAYYNRPGHDDHGDAIAVDNAGKVYVTGNGGPSATHNQDYLTLAYDALTGAQLDVSRYAGSAGLSDLAAAIATDGLGCVYVTGYCTNVGQSQDIVTIKYNRPAVMATIDIDPNKLNLKSRGKWVTGYVELPEGFAVEDIVTSTVAISAIDGDILDPPLYRDGPTEKGDYDSDEVSDLMVKFSRQELVGILVDMGYGDGDKPELTVTGGLAGDTTFKGVAAIELIDKKDGGQGKAADLPGRVSIKPTSPNPFRLATSLSYGLPTATHVRLDVYSPTGQRVATLVDRLEDAGYHNATWDGRDDAGRELAAGIYLCRFEAGTYKTTRKTQLLR